MDARIAKKMAKRNKDAGEVRYPFGSNTEANTKTNDSQKYKEDDDDSDFLIEGGVVNQDITAPKDNKQVNINDGGWDDTQAIVYVDEPETKPKGPSWGDALKVTGRAEIPDDENYFPTLGDEPKEKRPAKKNNSGLSKNNGLFAAGGNWGAREKPVSGGLLSGGLNNDRFSESSGAMRFTSKKGDAVINKFMQPAGGHGAQYDENLGDEGTTEKIGAMVDEGVAPIKFKGKVKVGSDQTDADIQREKYLAECRERAEMQDERELEIKEIKEAAPKFTSKAGGRNAGLFMSGDGGNAPMEPVPQQQQPQEGAKRMFTNSKKVVNQGLTGPQLDPTIPTVGKDGIRVAVSAKGWD